MDGIDKEILNDFKVQIPNGFQLLVCKLELIHNWTQDNKPRTQIYKQTIIKNNLSQHASLHSHTGLDSFKPEPFKERILTQSQQEEDLITW